MAHLTGEVLGVLLVHLDPIQSVDDFTVAVGAGGLFLPVVAMRRRRIAKQLGRRVTGSAILPLVGVHLIHGMAIHTSHARLAKVDIRPNTFVLAEVFLPYAASVTGGAIARHGGFGLEDVPGDKPAAYRGGLADVAISTGRVTTGTMVAKHLFQGRMIFRRTAFIQHRPVAALGKVQTGLISGDDVRMALSAESLAILAGACNQALVGGLLVG